MPLHIDQVVTPTTADEIETAVLDLCATGGLPTSSWQPGDPIRTYIKQQSAAFAMKSLVDVEYVKGGFGDLASGVWVKMWAQEIYNVIFVPAKPATGYWMATNAGVTAITLNPGDLIIAHDVTHKTYRNQASVTIPGGTTTSAPGIAISSDELGTASNAAPNEIKTVVSSLVGLSGTNPLAVLGADEEQPAALVARTRSKLGSFSPLGPKDAYDYVARTPLDSFPAVNGTLLTPTSTPITRSRTSADPVTGNVTVYLATAGGAPSAPDVALVNLGLQRWAEPWCVTATGAAAANVVIDITYRLWLRSSLTAAQVQSLVQIALAAYLSGVPVGGVIVPPDTGAVYVEAIENVIHSAVPGTVRVSVTLPAADILMDPYQVAVLGTVTPTVSFL